MLCQKNSLTNIKELNKKKTIFFSRNIQSFVSQHFISLCFHINKLTHTQILYININLSPYWKQIDLGKWLAVGICDSEVWRTFPWAYVIQRVSFNSQSVQLVVGMFGHSSQVPKVVRAAKTKTLELNFGDQCGSQFTQIHKI